ncbi:MAG: family 20 glycosylhydrolase, partial [Myxococcaceae bacterium]
ARVSTCHEALQPTADRLVARLREVTGFAWKQVADAPEVELRLCLDSGLEREGSTLSVTKSGVAIFGGDAPGVERAVQTFWQLLPVSPPRGALQVGLGEIRDAPRFVWRGLMVDLARHFFGLEELKKLVRAMAAYKLNRLHLHLTDDQGWRLEIRSRPSLTVIGGAGAVGGAPGGFLTQAEYSELVAYAAGFFITVVPEIDLPGHVNAALASVPELNCDGVAPAPYTGTMVGFSSLCASAVATQPFVHDVISEVAALTPGAWIHVGGDEAKMTTADDYLALTSMVRAEVADAGKQLIGWEELARADAGIGTIVQHWLDPSPASAAAARGAQVIVSPAKRAYLDMQYSLNVPSPRVGTFWAGFVEVSDAYGWDPGAWLADGGVRESQVLGVEGAAWTETIATEEQLEVMVFPRVVALAELGWSAQRNPRTFFDRLGRHGPRLRQLGVGFFSSTQVSWVE